MTCLGAMWCRLDWHGISNVHTHFAGWYGVTVLQWRSDGHGWQQAVRMHHCAPQATHSMILPRCMYRQRR